MTHYAGRIKFFCCIYPYKPVPVNTVSHLTGPWYRKCCGGGADLNQIYTSKTRRTNAESTHSHPPPAVTRKQSRRGSHDQVSQEEVRGH